MNLTNYDDQARVIEDAKRDFDRVYAVMERNRENRNELVGLVGVMNDSMALLLDLNDEGERNIDGSPVKYHNGIDDRVLARRLHLTSMHRLVEC